MSNSNSNERNQVFKSDSTIQTRNIQEMVKTEFGVENPIEIVPLPSLGLVYPSNSPFHNKDTVSIRTMTTREEDILMNRAFIKKGTVLTELVKSCLVTPGDPNELLMCDRNALMFAIRVTGYGSDYEVEVECPDCNEKFKNVFQLAELPIKTLEILPVAEGTNCFEFTLPASKQLVKFKFLTGADELDILTIQALNKKKSLGPTQNDSVSLNLKYNILEVGGVANRAKISNFVDHMSARDSLALRTYIANNEPGIQMKQDVNCPGCGETNTIFLPITRQFLWPST